MRSQRYRPTPAMHRPVMHVSSPRHSLMTVIDCCAVPVPVRYQSSRPYTMRRTQTDLEELPEPLRVKRAQGVEVLVDRRVVHAHPAELHLPQPGQVFLAGFGVDGPLQPGRFAEDLATLRVFGVERGDAREGPAQRGEAFHHEAVEAGEARLGRLDDTGILQVRTAPGIDHAGEYGEGELGGGEVGDVLGKMLDGGDDGLERRLVDWGRLVLEEWCNRVEGLWTYRC